MQRQSRVVTGVLSPYVLLVVLLWCAWVLLRGHFRLLLEQDIYVSSEAT